MTGDRFLLRTITGPSKPWFQFLHHHCSSVSITLVLLILMPSSSHCGIIIIHAWCMYIDASKTFIHIIYIILLWNSLSVKEPNVASDQNIFMGLIDSTWKKRGESSYLKNLNLITWLGLSDYLIILMFYFSYSLFNWAFLLIKKPIKSDKF